MRTSFFSSIVFLFLFTGKSISQCQIILKTQSCIFSRSQKGGYFEIPVSITNNGDTSILIPGFPNVYDRLGMSEWEIGIDLFSIDSSKRIDFDISYDFVLEHSMVILKPGETRSIVAKIPSGLFRRKEVLNIILYLMVPIPHAKDQEYNLYSSNRVKMEIL
jgi:hypothetical protein